jgi:hypothetical protein
VRAFGQHSKHQPVWISFIIVSRDAVPTVTARPCPTVGLFSLTGTADPTLYPEAPVTGNLNGSPTSRGYILNVAWWPQQNIGLTAQYTGYTWFNGESTNYDLAGC